MNSLGADELSRCEWNHDPDDRMDLGALRPQALLPDFHVSISECLGALRRRPLEGPLTVDAAKAAAPSTSRSAVALSTSIPQMGSFARSLTDLEPGNCCTIRLGFGSATASAIGAEA